MTKRFNMPVPPPKLITMLERIIALPSVSSTDPQIDSSNKAVIDELAGWLKPMGFEVEIMALAKEPGKYNLLATLGSGPGGLVLAGHSDTVPYDEGLWQQDPFKLTEQDNKFFGLGTSDMKGFFPIAIEAAKKFIDTPLQQPLMILATADEETSMSGARALAEIGKPKARYAIIGEPTGMKPVRMHKGITMESVQIQGKSGHSSDPSLGKNALDAMYDAIGVIMQWRKQLQEKYHNPLFEVPVPSLNLGCIHGGDNPNRICGHCELQFDIRPLPGMNLDNLRHELKRLLLPIGEKHRLEIELLPLFPGIPAFETDANADLVKMAEKLTGHQAGAVAFGTEAPFLTRLGAETLVLGPGDIEQAHRPDEYLGQERINPSVDLLTNFIQKCCL